MKILLKILLPLVIIFAALSVTQYLKATATEAKKRDKPRQVTSVEVLTLVQSDYPIRLQTHGIVEARTKTSLLPEVSGQITKVSPNFRVGRFFKKGEILLAIDARNYRNAIAIAKAEWVQKRVALKQERAQADQALRDWEGLGMSGKPDDLVLRKPQMEAAQAAVDVAQARLEQAELDLERTRLRAPYEGRVLEQKVDIGQYISPGTQLGVIYAIDYAEIRLPLSQQQLRYVNIPGRFRGAKKTATTNVKLSADGQSWSAKLVRTEGTIDEKSRQQFVIARIDNPYERRKAKEPLEIGRFVEAEIKAKVLSNVFVIPRASVRNGNEVQLVIDGKLQRRQIEVQWSDAKNIIVKSGFSEGDVLIQAPLSFVANGASVKIAGEEEEPKTGEADQASSKADSHAKEN